jgi:hypothetical protein
MAIMAVGIGDAVITTDGTGVAVIINGATIAAITIGKASLDSLIVIPLPGRGRIAAARTGRAHVARPVQLHRTRGNS